eukprot:13422178-Alexandrium_andersonii.AAC.1
MADALRSYEPAYVRPGRIAPPGPLCRVPALEWASRLGGCSPPGGDCRDADSGPEVRTAALWPMQGG